MSVFRGQQILKCAVVLSAPFQEVSNHLPARCFRLFLGPLVVREEGGVQEREDRVMVYQDKLGLQEFSVSLQRRAFENTSEQIHGVARCSYSSTEHGAKKRQENKPRTPSSQDNNRKRDSTFLNKHRLAQMSLSLPTETNTSLQCPYFTHNKEQQSTANGTWQSARQPPRYFSLKTSAWDSCSPQPLRDRTETSCWGSAMSSPPWKPKHCSFPCCAGQRAAALGRR